MDKKQEDLIKKIKIKMWLGLILIIVIGVSIAIYFIFINPIEGERDLDAATVETNLNNNTNSRLSNNNSNQSNLCEIGKIYKHTAVQPIDCLCPTGYEFEVVSMSQDPCPEEGIADCPAYDQECVKIETVNNKILPEAVKVNIQTYTNQSCASDEDCGFFPCYNNECLIKECTCSCSCPDSNCGGDDSLAPGYCISIN